MICSAFLKYENTLLRKSIWTYGTYPKFGNYSYEDEKRGEMMKPSKAGN